MTEMPKKPSRIQPPAPPPPSSPPAGPAARAPEGATKGEGEAKKVDPTRFGDWEKNGRCIDF